MNKKLIAIIISCLTILLTLLMVVFSAFRVAHPQEVFGQEAVEQAIEQAVVGQEVDYILPYPGILPDHPLYWLKMIRDRVWGSLIYQPYQKTNWLMLMADKRLAAAEQLVAKDQTKLALTTASKAEKYLEKTINKFSSLNPEQQIDLQEKIQQAITKHEELLKSMITQVKGNVAADLERLLIYPQEFKSSLLD